MNINRHNYEEYFILYLDNELNSTERRMVESFVQHHPDLKDELDILLQSKLTPDNNIVFEGKEELMKIGNDSAINLTNYEEWLTLYIDNELSFDQKKQVEIFFSSNPQVQNEFSLLQKTKLQPEEIIFPYKESLYRKTEKVRVIQMRWWRVAAAAILLLAIGTTAVIVLNKKKQPEQGLASKNNQNTKTNNPVIKKPDDKEQNQLPILTPDNKPSIAQTSEQKQNSKTNIVKIKLEDIPAKKEDQVTVNNEKNKPSNNLPQLENNSTETIRPPDKTTINIYNTEVNDLATTNTIKPAAFVTTNPSPTSDIKQGNTSGGLRGFFRKVTRTIEKRTGITAANDDDRILIGGLAVKLN